MPKKKKKTLFEMDLWFRLISIINCERKVYVNIKYATCGHGHKSTVMWLKNIIWVIYTSMLLKPQMNIPLGS